MLSNCGFYFFKRFSEIDINTHFSPRTGEIKLGDTSISRKENSRFIILGIAESIGPLSNLGLSGSEKAFRCFLNYFLNSQSANFHAEQVCILGQISISKPITKELSRHVLDLDIFVAKVLANFLETNDIPIIIGGGHNNSFPIMKWCREQNSDSPIHILNIDPHADCRNTDSRHSGNSFSLAIMNGLINHYSVLGLHEAYNNIYILDFLKKYNIYHTYFEDYLFKKRNIKEDIAKAIEASGSEVGIEIDLDSIAHFPSSAKSPCGWSENEIRFILNEILKGQSKVYYLHLPEASPQNSNDEKIVGKMLTYIVRDFVNFMSIKVP